MRRFLHWISVCALILAVVAQPLTAAAVADVSQSPDLNLDAQGAPASDTAADADTVSETDSTATPPDEAPDADPVSETASPATPSDQATDADTGSQTDSAATASDQAAHTAAASQAVTAAPPP